MTARSQSSAVVPPAAARAESGSLYQLLVESVRDYAIFALDPTGHIVTWNVGAERFKGYKPHEIIGKHFSVFYTPEEANVKPPMELAIAEKEGRVEDEGWRVRKDGTRMWANVVITALRDETGKLVGFAKVTRDLTERREAEQKALFDATRLAEVEAANRAKSEFLAAMSHELRTPLNAIGGYAELLMMGIRGDVSEDQRADLERIQRSQRNLLSLINDILNYAKLEAGHVEFDMKPVPLHPLLLDLESLITPQLRARELTYDYTGCDPTLTVWADAEKVRQILLNLLSNAIKFTEPGGTIAITCADRDEMVNVVVRDTGFGIPADRLSSVFEPFVQLERRLTSNHEGTGLGLAISRDLARGLGGELSARSEIGQGSEFELSLKKVPAASGQQDGK